MDAFAMLEDLTYQIEHSPNCPSPYLVRAVTYGTGGLDKLPTHETKDTFAYGRTLNEAAGKVLFAHKAQRARAIQK